jgi:hypothetical protein
MNITKNTAQGLFDNLVEKERGRTTHGRVSRAAGRIFDVILRGQKIH